MWSTQEGKSREVAQDIMTKGGALLSPDHMLLCPGYISVRATEDKSHVTSVTFALPKPQE
jgi:hypothetical protein